MSAIPYIGFILTEAPNMDFVWDCQRKGGYNTIKVVATLPLADPGSWNDWAINKIYDLFHFVIVRTGTGDNYQDYRHNPNAVQIYPEVAVSQLQRWYDLAVARGKTDHVAFELGNEPNVPKDVAFTEDAIWKWQFWLDQARRRCREAFPHAKLCSPGLTGDNFERWYEIGAGVIGGRDESGRDNFDYVGVHVYSSHHYIDHENGDPPNAFRNTVEVVNKFFSGKEWLLTEYGIHRNKKKREHEADADWEERKKEYDRERGRLYAQFIHDGYTDPPIPENIKAAVYYHLCIRGGRPCPNGPEGSTTEHHEDYNIYPCGDVSYALTIGHDPGPYDDCGDWDYLGDPIETLEPLAARYDSAPPTHWQPGQTHTYPVVVTNTGSQVWNAADPDPVHLGVHFGGLTDDIDPSTWATDQRFPLPHDVPPDQSITLQLSVTAPTPGSYILRHRMVKENVRWFKQMQKTSVAVQQDPRPGPPRASYQSTAPLEWRAGETRTFDVTVTNTGPDTWPLVGDTRVRFGMHFVLPDQDSDNQDPRPWQQHQRWELPHDVSPGQSVTFHNLAVTAPSAPGVYRLHHRIVRESVKWSSDIYRPDVRVVASQLLLDYYVPAPNGLLRATVVSIAGWAIDRAATSGTGVDQVGVYLDDVFKGHAVYGARQDDIGASFGANFANSGWHFRLDLSRVAPGQHVLEAKARSTVSGQEQDFPRAFYVAQPFHVHIDRPNEGGAFCDRVTFHGWAADSAAIGNTGVDRVTLVVDGRREVQASYGQERQDVANHFRAPHFLHSGWVADVGALEPGRHSVEVKAHSAVHNDEVRQTRNVVVDRTPRSFCDVPPNHYAFRAVEALFGRGIVQGMPVTSDWKQRLYKPDESVTRAGMPVFLLRIQAGGPYTPPAPPPTSLFADVPPSHPQYAWICEVFKQGLILGCQPSPDPAQRRYCPGDIVTRAHMAAFVLRLKKGKGYQPPPGQGNVFADVSKTHWAAGWIEQLFAEELTTGCRPSSDASQRRYCPDDPLTRGMAAAFLARLKGWA